MAFKKTQIPPSLYSHIRILAQPSRDLVQYHHTESHQAGLLQIRERTHRQNPNLHRQLQQDVEAIRLDRHRSIHPPENRTIM
jgi:hypothetical protein